MQHDLTNNWRYSTNNFLFKSTPGAGFGWGSSEPSVVTLVFNIYGKADNQWYIKPRGMYVCQTSAVCEAIHRYAPKFYQHGHFATQILLVVRTSLATYNFHS